VAKLPLLLWLKFSRLIPTPLHPHLGGLRKNLAKASIRLGFEAYLGLTAFTATVTAILTALLSFLLLSLFPITLPFLQPLPLALLFGVGGGVIAGGTCYAYPLYVASSRGNNIDANLPIIANFMSVLASSGIPPEAIFESLAVVGKEFKIDKEISGIIADIKLRGLDLYQALHLAAEKSPSEKFGSMIDGTITTSHLGGDLAGYLRDRADKFKNDRTLRLRRFIENLAIVAEIYITFMVVAPLMLIVMLSVMSFLGGSDIMPGFGDPLIILNLMTFILLPAGVSVLILIVDGMSPTR
jgi:flagellar protein FlaJ